MGTLIPRAIFVSLPTFYRIYKKKTTEGFQAIPYITALFSLTLWIYYAIFVKDATFLITINTFGIVIESIYIAIFLIYSPKKAMLSTIKIILLLNVFGFGAIVLSTLYLTKGDKRVTLIKWFNLILNICIFTSPLDNLRCVVKTKSVEFIYRSINCNIII
nr:bidirectional sugar transporter SWEET14-like [Arachis hypogaea]